VPTIAEFGETVYRSYVSAPFGNADQALPGAYGAEDRSCAGGEGDDSQIAGRGRLHKESVANALVALL
jgi:hypothetical protein